jgi:hypothetical protein
MRSGWICRASLPLFGCLCCARRLMRHPEDRRKVQPPLRAPPGQLVQASLQVQVREEEYPGVPLQSVGRARRTTDPRESVRRLPSSFRAAPGLAFPEVGFPPIVLSFVLTSCLLSDLSLPAQMLPVSERKSGPPTIHPRQEDDLERQWRLKPATRSHEGSETWAGTRTLW